jgi:capsular polysaccharide transport system ATP-binding protein
MLTLDNVEVWNREKREPIFENLSFKLGRRRALVFAEDEKLTAAFLRLVIGHRPDSGTVVLEGRPSWPIGQSGIVRGLTTGREFIRFLASLYNLDIPACMADAERWFSADLLATTTNLWSSKERARLERLCVLWPDFDIYLTYGAGGTGDPVFDQEWTERFDARLEGRGMIAIAPPFEPWDNWCDIVVLLRGGEVVCYETVADALTAATAVATGDLLDGAPNRRQEQAEDDILL